MNIWIIIFLLLSIIILGCIILAYYGIFRKLSLSLKEPEEYIQSYRELEKVEDALQKYRFVISLTATPETISKMKIVISSLLDQTVKVDEICINIPPDTVSMIPPYMQKCLRVYKINKDYGPSNNIIPTINREKSANTVLLALENNVIYGKDFVQQITERYWSPKYTKKDTVATQINNGVVSGSIVTLVSNFDPKIVNVDNQTDDVFLYPDKWISDHIKGEKHHFRYSENYTAFIPSKR